MSVDASDADVMDEMSHGHYPGELLVNNTKANNVDELQSDEINNANTISVDDCKAHKLKASQMERHTMAKTIVNVLTALLSITDK